MQLDFVHIPKWTIDDVCRRAIGFKSTIPDRAVIITIIPWPHINSANMNPEEIQISSLKVPLLTEDVMAKTCPKVCSVLKI